MDVYLTSTVKLNSVKFHSGASTQTPRSAPTFSAMYAVVGWQKIYTSVR